MIATVTYPPRSLTWVEKLMLLAALAVAAGLFLSIGWLALAPDDPRGAVSLLTHSRPLLMVVQVAAVAFVAAALATLIIGTRLPDVGVFAAALGMATVSVRGDTAAYLLVHQPGGSEAALAGRMAIEALVWFAVLAGAALVSALVMRWLAPGDDDSLDRAAIDGRMSLTDTAVGELASLAWHGLPARGSQGNAARNAVPAQRGRAREDPIAPRSTVLDGLQFFGVVTAAAVALFSLAVAGSSPRAIHHGQIVFAVFAALYVGTWVAKRWSVVRTPLWGLLAVAVVPLLGYLWTIMGGSALGGSSRVVAESIPASRFLRALPLTFVSVGALGMLTAYWTIHPPPRLPARPQPPRPKRR